MLCPTRARMKNVITFISFAAASLLLSSCTLDWDNLTGDATNDGTIDTTTDMCPAGLTLCGGVCVDTMSDINHCGGCGNTCEPGLHASPLCDEGECKSECLGGWTDEDGDGDCETCVPTGPEACNGVDDNCNGAIDEDFECIAGAEVGCTTECGSLGIGTCGPDCEPPGAADCTPPIEQCNGDDDDCDGVCDNGYECCRGGSETGDACEDGGVNRRECNDACFWGEWICVEEGECAPGDTQSCELCGTRTCGDSGTWGACLDRGECETGDTEDRDCGNCGTQGRSCSGSCEWSAWTPCSGEGECERGRTETDDCGYCGTRSRTCSDSCTWGSWSGCSGEGECERGRTETDDCGYCGTRSRTCSDSCNWGSWGSCSGEGECEANTASACPECGQKFCGSDCRWIRDSGGNLCCSMVDNNGDNRPDTDCGYVWQYCTGCGESCCWQWCNFSGYWYDCSPGC